MGTIRAEKRGKTWQYSFEGVKVGGKRKRITKGGFQTKSEALLAGTKAKAEYDSTGKLFQASQMSLSDYMDFWLQAYASQLKPRTYSNYSQITKNHIKPILGSYPLSAIDTIMIQGWVNEMRAGTISKGTLNTRLTCLSSALDYACTVCGYIKYNPCKAVKILPYAKTPEIKEAVERNGYVLSKADYIKVSTFLRGKSGYLPFEIAYRTGARAMEVYGIDLLHDVDYKAHTLHIEHQIQRIDGVWHLVSPKYDSERTIKIDPELTAMLKAEMIRQKANRLKFGPGYQRIFLAPDGHLIESPDKVPESQEVMLIYVWDNGALRNANGFTYISKMIKKKLGLKHFHFHSLRHTHGTILAENGATPNAIKDRLGHKSIETTLERYVFTTDKMESDTLRIFEEYLAG